MRGEQRFRFVCSHCGEEMTVDAGMRDELLSNGCVVCGGRAVPGAFTPD